jgi:hypothetical protein
VTCFKDHLHVFQSAYNQLNPGGYLELQDLVLPMRAIDSSLEGTNFNHWQLTSLAAAAKVGMAWNTSGSYARLLEEAGFVDVTEQHFQWPMNRWPKGDHMKTLGSYWQEDLLRGAEAMSLAALTRYGGMSKAEADQLIAEAKADIPDKRIHAYCPM